MTSVSPTREGYPADLRALTSPRAFLALGVVLFHYPLPWDPALGFSPFIERSRLAVDAFFMLSGFILAHVYGPSFAAGTFRYRSFIVARLARLYPLHLAVLLGLLVMVLGALAFGVRYDPSTFTVRVFFETLFLVQAWFPSAVGYNWSGRPGPSPPSGSPICFSRPEPMIAGRDRGSHPFRPSGRTARRDRRPRRGRSDERG